MNQEQLQKLRTMTILEIAIKYCEKVSNKEITPKQFDWLLKQGRDYKEPIRQYADIHDLETEETLKLVKETIDPLAELV